MQHGGTAWLEMMGFGGPETVGVLLILAILGLARFLPPLLCGHSKGVEKWKALRAELVVWLAQGFGIGRIPFAPGTFGSVLGVLWAMLLTATGNLWFYLAGMLAGVGLSVWLCGAGERLLQEKDPGSIVLDEIVALPICFLPWMIGQWLQQGTLPLPDDFFAGRAWMATLALFVLFRVFDILKPWPVRQSQHLAGGWGVTADDVLAALYVAVCSLVWVA